MKRSLSNQRHNSGFLPYKKCSEEFTVTVTEVLGGRTGTTTTTNPGEGIDASFILSIAGIAVAVLVLIVGIGAFLSARKKS